MMSSALACRIPPPPPERRRPKLLDFNSPCRDDWQINAHCTSSERSLTLAGLTSRIAATPGLDCATLVQVGLAYRTAKAAKDPSGESLRSSAHLPWTNAMSGQRRSSSPFHP
jgi:hypothetical protein